MFWSIFGFYYIFEYRLPNVLIVWQNIVAWIKMFRITWLDIACFLTLTTYKPTLHRSSGLEDHRGGKICAHTQASPARPDWFNDLSITTPPSLREPASQRHHLLHSATGAARTVRANVVIFIIHRHIIERKKSICKWPISDSLFAAK